MYLLGGWALANMSTGVFGWARYENEQKYFHQMNAAWNLVNAGIATYALLSMDRDGPEGLSGQELMRRHIRSEHIYLINAGLDLLYMAGGALMIHAAGNSTTRPGLLKGYGQSVLLQGGFLFLFDLAKFGIQYRRRQHFEASLLGAGISPHGLSVVIAF